MKTVQINTNCGTGSTGRICVGISDTLSKNAVENYVLYAQGETDHPSGIKFSDSRYKKLQSLKSRIFGNWGFNSKLATKRLIKHLERIDPQIIHLHNIHGHDCDLNLLFEYFKVKKVKLIWTFHDCWAFTAYCPHFDMLECDKWKNRCGDCPYVKNASWFFDRSESLFNKKKALFSDLDLTVVTPSRWLAGLVRESFLKEYPVKVINNGIDLSVFRPAKSNFREKYNLGDSFVILGVAFGWDYRKGLDVFARLAEQLGDAYRIVLVGTDGNVDKQLNENIISVHRTQNQAELAEIYSAADLFVNPTREDTYPTVNMESLACGTPVLTFATGGSPEMLDPSCGSVVPKDDVDGLIKEIKRIRETKPYSEEACLAHAEAFDMNSRFQEYADLYRSL